MAEELLTIRQAALLLSVSETSLRRWTNAGVLASLRVGGRRERRFRREDLEAFMEHVPAEGGEPTLAGGDSHHGETVPVGATPVHLGAHLCGFYASDPGRQRLAANFLLDGVNQHGACFLVGAEKTRNAVLTRLREKNSQVDKHVAAGRLVLDKQADTPSAQLKFWEKRMALALRDGARSLRAVADISAFARASRQMLDDYEGGYEDKIARRFPVITLCVYDAREATGLSMLAALKAHQDTSRYFAYHLLA